MKESGIVPIPSGGLGNQIFITMAGYIASLYNNCPLYLLNNDNSNCHSNNNYKYSIFNNIGIKINETGSTIRLNPDFKHYSNHFLNPFQGFEVWNIDSIKPNMILDSYYQYYEPFSKYENEIRDVLLNGLESYRKELKLKYLFENCAFLHIRRGDYLQYADRYYIQPISYYDYCVKKLLEYKPNISKIYILSDDNYWVKNEPFFQKDIFQLILDCDHEEKALAFMSLCSDGSICANSTFSWWGAFLGSYQLRNPVFAPKEWIFSHIKCQIFPKEWNLV